MKFGRNTKLSFREIYSHYKGDGKCVIHLKSMAGLAFQSNKLNKPLMIKQIGNVRKEVFAPLMNGSVHRIFMSSEATWLVPLFHLKFILPGTSSAVLETTKSALTAKANFNTPLDFASCPTRRFNWSPLKPN